MRYEDAVETLFQAPHDQFVAERKRLAGELKATGDKDGAARLAKLGRPPISAWVVDQLWWRARSAFEALFDTAERVRRGEVGATAAHRDALARLRSRAVQILSDAQHGTTEATLRRVMQTLAALAAAGGWAPDAPGALSADRDPPGFEAIGISNVIPFPVQPRPTHEAAHAPAAQARESRDAREQRDADDTRARRDREAAAARAEAAADLRRAEAERARAAAERHRLEAALRTAHGDVAQREREVVKLERDLAYARGLVAQAKEVVVGLEERLAQLDN
ncbi:MAG TPA: hypothetical protein VK607_24410 [Kofleriaceae bacterium]|nr:hypothetical protein [Kofleriaceae bacterium]